ncbi:DUF7283 family protein [Halosimplex pelagicum]|uniref:Uncharacterized protein n=1 Tax=Halosimplex pelagicum TaxID=869886 RepID=A0A7D5P3Z0_9EURY|nr:hypothetical protein [Halosimplex pelagicum]QLH80157.1 hypothetical protein HZS54_00305 [Halosimplex pelagicum]
MELESPADAWYVWFGVALVSLAFVGVVASFPSEPPPDTAEAADAIDRVTASGYNATAEYEHDADRWYVANKTIVMKNDGGTTRASLSYARVVPVWADRSPPDGPDGDLRAVLRGTSASGEYDDPAEFRADVRKASEFAENSIDDPSVPKWRIADGRLVVRHVKWGDYRATLVTA